MKIAVCVKQVPDSWAEKKLNASTKLIDRESVDAVLNDLDEYAVESALQIVEANGGVRLFFQDGSLPGYTARQCLLSSYTALNRHLRNTHAISSRRGE